MRITRIYADDEGVSHFAEQDIELRDSGPIGHLSAPIPAKAVIFRQTGSDYDYDWHVAPRRQFILLLDGAIEIEVADGSRKTFRGGDILLVEDTVGKGHRSRHIEAQERRSVFIALE